MFETLANLLAGGAWVAHQAHTREDSGSGRRSFGSVFYAENAHDFWHHGAHHHAAFDFGRAGETEGRHNSRWPGCW